MRIKDGFELVNHDGQSFVINTDNVKKEIHLSKFGLFLWKLLKGKEVSKSKMLNELLSAFDISTVLALGEIDLFLRTMRESEIIEE